MYKYKMMKNLKRLMILSCLSITLWSCSKQLDLSPQNAIPVSSLGVNDIPQLRTGLYATMEDVLFNFWFDFDKRGENLTGGPGYNVVDPVSMNASDADITSYWRGCYKGINTANILIQNVNNLGAGATTTQLSYKGEALYFRALIYYDLVIRYGGVPILLKSSTDAVQRSSEAQVWAQIKSDLIAARSLVSAFGNNLYVSDQAVKALMARVYLATGDNANAITYADSLINYSSGKFALSTDSMSYSSMFTAGTASKEIIFALANNSTASTHSFLSQVNDTKATWPYSPAMFTYKNLYSDASAPLIKTGDKRKAAVFSADPTRIIKFPNGKTGQQLAVSPTPIATPIIISRLAEMYLIKAEAQGASAGSVTLASYLTNRYKLAPTAASIAALTASQYQDMILNESRREFFGEGHWWYDIKRTGRTDLLTTLNGRTYLLYYPIPQTEKDLAGYTQNPGY
ncbi:RagB/SusD family nutrient uptake outer membrane protein [Mucilaginibacter sp. RCC_168]|uniref:RagB/SusD family nutrient uptake outer membrane protein n=1 Tax=Mucilaginibacter sp. RCC_168 TaxID=3239221 RepID=UPI003523A1C6